MLKPIWGLRRLVFGAGALAILSATVGALPARAAENACLECHGDTAIEPTWSKRSKEGLHVAADALRGSIHEDLGCTDCHAMADTEAASHYDEKGPRPKLQCATCHEEQTRTFDTACIHGTERAAGNEKAPWCNDCHGGHDMAPLRSEASRLSPKNQAEVCGKCHGDEPTEGKGHIAQRRLVDRYRSSVHWAQVKEGKPAATCTDCHGYHSILPSSDKESKVTQINVISTCQKCHPAVVKTYVEGAHGRTLLNGNHDVPTCTTCHGDHDMTSLKIKAGGTRDYAATQVCIWCHGNQRMMARYALDTSPVESYMRDFHGLSQRSSLGTTATCSDCHDAHHSLPSSHPESRMHISNRGSACGKCHGKTSESFIMSFSHKTVTRDATTGRVKRIIALVYIGLIAVVIGGMLLHNWIVFRFFVRLKRNYQERAIEIVRLSRGERAWHLALLLSFGLLVVTGFALSFSESTAFSWLYDLGVTESIRGWLHRLGGVVMTVDMIVVVLWLASGHRRRKWWVSMWPRWQDFKDLVDTMAYYLGQRQERPRYAVFNYAEKAEYWGLWWGVLVMVITGVVMWFSDLLPEGLPPWGLEALRTVHFYEAVLATMTIAVWHLFHTIFHPAEYPMNTAWLTGGLTREEAEERFTDEAIETQRPVPEPAASEPPAAHRPWLPK